MVYYMNEEAYVREFGFRRFKGYRRGRIYRLGVIVWFNMIHQWRRSRVFKALIGLIIFMLIISNLFLLVRKDSLLQTKSAFEIFEDHLWTTIRNFIRFQVMIASPDDTNLIFDTGYSMVMIIGFSMMGSGLISDDKKYQVMEIYKSKIAREDYLIAKLGALIVFGNLFLTLPCILEWLLLIIGIGGINFFESIPILVKIIIITEIITLVLSSFMLAFSSLTTRRLYAGLLGFMFFLALSIVVQSFTGQITTFKPIMYLDLFTVLSVLSFVIAGENEVIYYSSSVEEGIILDLTGIAGLLVIPTILFFIGLGLLICCIQIIYRDSGN